MKKFELAQSALGDLQDIWEFISEDSFDAADRVLEDFDKAFQQLAEMPEIGRKRPDLTQRELLCWPVYSYLIIYTNSTPFRVLRILHGKRDAKKLLKNC